MAGRVFSQVTTSKRPKPSPIPFRLLFPSSSLPCRRIRFIRLPPLYTCNVMISLILLAVHAKSKKKCIEIMLEDAAVELERSGLVEYCKER
jgi:hypothetical protein